MYSSVIDESSVRRRCKKSMKEEQMFMEKKKAVGLLSLSMTSCSRFIILPTVQI